MATRTLIIATAPVATVLRTVAAVRERDWGEAVLYRKPQPAIPGEHPPATVALGEWDGRAFGSRRHLASLRAMRWRRVVLVYNNRAGIGYRHWRRFARSLGAEAWVAVDADQFHPLTRDRQERDDWRETVEALIRGYYRGVVPCLLKLGWGLWSLGRRLGPEPRRFPWRFVAAVLRETGGRETVSRQIRMLHLARAMARETVSSMADLGAADGLLLRIARGLSGDAGTPELLGVDREFSPATRRRADAAKIHLLAADLETCSPAGRFDCLVVCEVLEHMAADSELVRRWGAALRPGGRLIVHVPWRGEKLLPGDVPQADHLRSGYTPEELRDLVRAAGLSVGDWEWTFAPETARLTWLDRRLQAHRLGSELARPWLLACALAELFYRPARGNGILLVARKPGCGPAP